MPEISSHAKSQRRYAEKLREKKIPRADDMGRALLKAAALCRPADLKTEVGRAWWHLMRTTIDELEKQGFDRSQVKHRLHQAIVDRRSRCK